MVLKSQSYKKKEFRNGIRGNKRELEASETCSRKHTAATRNTLCRYEFLASGLMLRTSCTETFLMISTMPPALLKTCKCHRAMTLK